MKNFTKILSLLIAPFVFSVSLDALVIKNLTTGDGAASLEIVEYGTGGQVVSEATIEAGKEASFKNLSVTINGYNLVSIIPQGQLLSGEIIKIIGFDSSGKPQIYSSCLVSIPSS